MKSPKTGSKSFLSRTFDAVLLAAFAVLIVWLAVVGIKISKGVAKTVEVPTHTVRLQLVEAGCGRSVFKQLEKELHGHVDQSLDITVVATGSFSRHDVKNSFLINRTDNENSSQALADLLGLKQDEIIHKKLDMNDTHITVTLVAGEDIATTVLTRLNERKEITTLD